MASSKLIHPMIFFKIAYVVDELHKSQVQHNILTMIIMADEFGEILNDVSDEFKLQALGSSQIWYWPSPLA